VWNPIDVEVSSITSVFSVQISDDPSSEMDRFENNCMCVID